MLQKNRLLSEFNLTVDRCVVTACFADFRQKLEKWCFNNREGNFKALRDSENWMETSFCFFCKAGTTGIFKRLVLML